jgi:hypothetical protein
MLSNGQAAFARQYWASSKHHDHWQYFSMAVNNNPVNRMEHLAGTSVTSYVCSHTSSTG